MLKSGALPKKMSHLGDDVDESAVFKTVVKRFSGQCVISELQSEVQHLFPPGLDVFSWLLKSKLFKVFKRRDSTKLDESLVFVKLDKLKLCLHNANCNLPYCPYIHLCRSFLAGSCNRVNCKFTHSLCDRHNTRVLKGLYLIEEFTEEEILSILKCCTLFVCSRWNRYGHCNLSKIYMVCPYLHMCQSFICGTCKNDNCKRGHSFDTPAVKLLLGPAFYDLHKVSKTSLCKAILLPKTEMSEGQEVESQKYNFVQREKKEGWNFGRKSAIRKVEVPELGKYMDAVQQPGAKAESQSDIHLYDDDVDRFICEANLRKQCSYGPRKCAKHHYPLPYVWQIKVDDIWETTTENESIEAAFCDVYRNNYLYFLNWNGSTRMMTIDFATMFCNDVDMFSFPVRRLTTESYMGVSKRHEYHTLWLWYWQDDAHQWIPYETDSLPYQDVIEAKYLADEMYCMFEVGKFQYLLDLVKMSQKNLKTGRSRCVRRRPHNHSNSTSILSAQHFDKNLLPPDLDWAPMNTKSYSTPELVLISTHSKHYEMVHSRFYETMNEKQYKIKKIIRIQNLALWDKYDRKKKVLQQCSYLKGDLNERYLFHGTYSDDIVRCIYKEGFDWRVCGKNATLYGNGTYFAKDASYSDRYARKNISGKKFMYLSLVLLGKYTQGKSGLTRPPLLDESKPDGGIYNSCVDNVNDPRIFVVFHDDQSYPEYLVEYEMAESAATGQNI